MVKRLQRAQATTMSRPARRRGLAFLWVCCLLMLLAVPGSLRAQGNLTPPPLTPRPNLPQRTVPVLLPTPTPSPTWTATATATAAVAITSVPTVTPTATGLPNGWVLLPTPTPSPTPTLTPTAVTTATTPGPAPAVPAPTAAPTRAASHSAEGSFFAQTVYPSGATIQQQGSFTILRVPAANAFGDNRRVTLTTRRGDGTADTVSVYEVDDYSAIGYAGDEWVVVSRERGSSIVKAIQPITDLADAFPRLLDQATFVEAEPIAGLLTLHYRIDDPARFGPLLIRPLLAANGEIRSLRLDAWIDALRGHVVRYSFQVEIGGARVYDATFNEVLADQAVTWTYRSRELDTPAAIAETVVWPAGAPDPNRVAVEGFAPGDFPLPPQSRLLAILAGAPEWQTPEPPAAVAAFYRRVLTAQGWTVEGENGLLQCRNGENTLTLLITPDDAGGTRFGLSAAP